MTPKKETGIDFYTSNGFSSCKDDASYRHALHNKFCGKGKVRSSPVSNHVRDEVRMVIKKKRRQIMMTEAELMVRTIRDQKDTEHWEDKSLVSYR
jgi:hypothetical protein